MYPPKIKDMIKLGLNHSITDIPISILTYSSKIGKMNMLWCSPHITLNALKIYKLPLIKTLTLAVRVNELLVTGLWIQNLVGHFTDMNLQVMKGVFLQSYILFLNFSHP